LSRNHDYNHYVAEKQKLWWRIECLDNIETEQPPLKQHSIFIKRHRFTAPFPLPYRTLIHRAERATSRNDERMSTHIPTYCKRQ